MNRIFQLLLIFSTCSSFSQKNESISRFSYQHNVNFYGNQSISRVENLFYNGSSSVFVVYGKDLNKVASETIVNNTSGGNVTVTMNGLKNSDDFVLYKNYRNRTMISREFIDNGDMCIVKDSIPNLNWVITSEKKKIGTYMCQKATTVFRCAKYTAWYASEIPLPIGPWKLGGLPGLIVQITDKRPNVTYEYLLLSMESPVTEDVYEINPPKTDDPKYSFEEYSKIQIKEAKKQRIFISGTSEDPANSGYSNVRPECY